LTEALAATHSPAGRLGSVAGSAAVHPFQHKVVHKSTATITGIRMIDDNCLQTLGINKMLYFRFRIAQRCEGTHWFYRLKGVKAVITQHHGNFRHPRVPEGPHVTPGRPHVGHLRGSFSYRPSAPRDPARRGLATAWAQAPGCPRPQGRLPDWDRDSHWALHCSGGRFATAGLAESHSGHTVAVPTGGLVDNVDY
jgi:hypothetical protein